MVNALHVTNNAQPRLVRKSNCEQEDMAARGRARNVRLSRNSGTRCSAPPTCTLPLSPDVGLHQQSSELETSLHFPTICMFARLGSQAFKAPRRSTLRAKPPQTPLSPCPHESPSQLDERGITALSSPVLARWHVRPALAELHRRLTDCSMLPCSGALLTRNERRLGGGRPSIPPLALEAVEAAAAAT